MLIENINWAEFLSRHDLVWNRLPMGYIEGPFIGNGVLGAIIYVDRDEPNGLRFEIGRSDVYDHRPDEADYGLRHNRMPIGYFRLSPAGKITGGSARLDLWNAEVTGEITTNLGRIRWTAFAGEDGALAFEIESSPGENECRFEWHAEDALSPHYSWKCDGDPGGYPPPPKPPVGYRYNPKPTISRTGDINVCVQDLLSGGDYATGWRVENPAPDRRIIYVTVCNKVPDTGSAEEAAAILTKAAAAGAGRMREKHRRWWHDFYRKSFISIPDTRMESFYWIQMYKMASATRENGAIMDLLGPWFKSTNWSCIWWNLNIQLAYWPMLGSNHPELGEPLYRLLDENTTALIENAPAEYRPDSAFLGNPTGYDLRNDRLCNGEGIDILCLPWTLHNYWLHYRHIMDERRLKEKLFPLMKRAWNLYLHVLQKREDGRYHLPLCYSSEYGNAEDTNQDLAIMRWGLQTMLDICRRLDIDDPLIPKWRDVLDNLVDFPQDENGLMVGKNVPFARSHRHYSHLFPIYPFHVLNAEGAETTTLMRRSIEHWLSLPEELTGFSWTGASSLMSCLGDGDAALEYLNKLFDTSAQPFSHLQPNTLYTEAQGWQWPTMETPLSGAQALLDMLIQSWGGTIRIFPAVPAAWRDIIFHNLRTEGAFLVSAVRKDGFTRFVRIESLAGEPCRIRCDLGGDPEVLGERSFCIESAENGILVIDLRKGEAVILRRTGDKTEFSILPVKPDRQECNYFGVRG